MKQRTSCFVFFFFVGLVACGAGERAPSQAPARSARSEEEGVERSDAPRQQAPAGQSAGAQPESSVTASGTRPPDNDEAAPGVAAARQGVRRDLEQARRELEIAAADCSSACKALASLERATARLCELVLSPADDNECANEKARAKKARERVRASCGACPGGRPSLDPGAPLSR